MNFKLYNSNNLNLIHHQLKSNLNNLNLIWGLKNKVRFDLVAYCIGRSALAAYF